MKNKGNQLPSFRKEGCPTGGVVGRVWFDLFIIDDKNRSRLRGIFLLPPPPSGTHPLLAPPFVGKEESSFAISFAQNIF